MTKDWSQRSTFMLPELGLLQQDGQTKILGTGLILSYEEGLPSVDVLEDHMLSLLDRDYEIEVSGMMM